MAEADWIEQLVSQVVSQALDAQVPKLREDLIRRVLQELRPQLEHRPVDAIMPGQPAGDNSSGALLKAVGAIYSGTTQKEILRALLDNTIPYSGRSALFVIKAGAASGWEGRGFPSNDDVKNFALDVASGAPAQVMQSRTATAGATSEIDSQFLSRFQAPKHDQILLLPLVVKDKVAALVYADGGEGEKLDAASLELLVTAAGAWLEVISLRKQSHKEPATESGEAHEAVPVQSVASYSDPFAGHAPLHVATPQAIAEPEPEPEKAAAAVAAVGGPPAMSAEDADVHRKAQRFARLLVDEIKLYNQAKVTEGRKHKDLYTRLKDEIDKSRSTYMKRYGNTAAASADHFSSELVRSLAEDDSSLMGEGFRR